MTKQINEIDQTTSIDQNDRLVIDQYNLNDGSFKTKSISFDRFSQNTSQINNTFNFCFFAGFSFDIIPTTEFWGEDDTCSIVSPGNGFVRPDNDLTDKFYINDGDPYTIFKNAKSIADGKVTQWYCYYPVRNTDKITFLDKNHKKLYFYPIEDFNSNILTSETVKIGNLPTRIIATNEDLASASLFFMYSTRFTSVYIRVVNKSSITNEKLTTISKIREKINGDESKYIFGDKNILIKNNAVKNYLIGRTYPASTTEEKATLEDRIKNTNITFGYGSRLKKWQDE